ncbi:MAG: hypothetical protein F4039_09955 [Gammaproteobacteria bacterium]|nr:hypothetical protein [Gammaproteobacteria bacterium]MYF53630.1 hypothetical protein [Gammaproteobacteria bacterium]MYK44395.1 hypothetical protein [Gammaproteobacteria bacterium]
MTEEPQTKRSKSWRLPKRPETSVEEFIELKRSFVRRCVSYLAMTSLFVGSPILIVYLLHLEKVDEALQVFNIVLPIASGVIGYWFAEQHIRSQNSEENRK